MVRWAQEESWGLEGPRHEHYQAIQPGVYITKWEVTQCALENKKVSLFFFLFPPIWQKSGYNSKISGPWKRDNDPRKKRTSISGSSFSSGEAGERGVSGQITLTSHLNREERRLSSQCIPWNVHCGKCSVYKRVLLSNKSVLASFPCHIPLLEIHSIH